LTLPPAHPIVGGLRLFDSFVAGEAKVKEEEKEQGGRKR
jgi:hypothetical protein